MQLMPRGRPTDAETGRFQTKKFQTRQLIEIDSFVDGEPTGNSYAVNQYIYDEGDGPYIRNGGNPLLVKWVCYPERGYKHRGGVWVGESHAKTIQPVSPEDFLRSLFEGLQEAFEDGDIEVVALDPEKPEILVEAIERATGQDLGDDGVHDVPIEYIPSIQSKWKYADDMADQRCAGKEFVSTLR